MAASRLGGTVDAVLLSCSAAEGCGTTGTLWNSPFFIVGVVVFLVAVVLFAIVRAIKATGRGPWK